MAPSATMKDSPQEEASRLVPTQGPLAYMVSPQRDLPSTSIRQLKALAAACNVLGVSWTTLTNNPNRVSHAWFWVVRCCFFFQECSS